jgi:hypothetical protein
MVYPLIHPKAWFVSSSTPRPTTLLPTLRPFKPNHKLGTIPAYLFKLKPQKTVVLATADAAT